MLASVSYSAVCYTIYHLIISTESIIVTINNPHHEICCKCGLKMNYLFNLYWGISGWHIIRPDYETYVLAIMPALCLIFSAYNAQGLITATKSKVTCTRNTILTWGVLWKKLIPTFYKLSLIMLIYCNESK